MIKVEIEKKTNHAPASFPPRPPADPLLAPARGSAVRPRLAGVATMLAIFRRSLPRPPRFALSGFLGSLAFYYLNELALAHDVGPDHITAAWFRCLITI